MLIWVLLFRSLEIMSLWLPRRYWIRAWEPVWRRAVQQYSSRVQSTEYRVQTRRNSRCLLIRTPAPPAAGNHNKTLVKCSCNLRFYAKGGDMKYLRVIQKFTFDTL